MRGRAFRRHQYERMKARVWRMERDTRYSPRFDPAHIGRMATTPHPCSCYMCGNPRRHFREPTMQERRANLEPTP